MTEAVLSMWVVYDHPRDRPADFIARRWALTGDSMEPTRDTCASPDLDRLRRWFMMLGYTRLDRSEGDDPRIVETWIE